MEQRLNGIKIVSLNDRVINQNTVFGNTLPTFENLIYEVINENLNFHQQAKLKLRHLKDPHELQQEAEDLRDWSLHLEPLTHLAHYGLTFILIIFAIITVVFPANPEL